MSYINKFVYTDKIVEHLKTVVGAIRDPEILISYSGFLSVSAITVYELAIKDIFFDFAHNQNKVFGIFVENHFERINGKIKIDHIVGDHTIKFGQKYRDRFKNLLNQREEVLLKVKHISMKSEYDNLIQCRHHFVHKGVPTLTINEVINAYEIGKEVIHCLNESLKR